MSTQSEKLIALLKELFQTDQAELDFGMYRVINQRRDEINRFLEEDLLPQVGDSFSTYQSVDTKTLQIDLKKAIQQAEDLGVDPETTTKVKGIREQIATYSVDVSDLENQVYSALYNFFRRYYDNGDFISQRRYKEGVYAIPYEGEEVKLHWANHDQYYIKTSEYLRDYTFKLPSGKKAHFKLVEADEEKDNRKEIDDNKRRFILVNDSYSFVDGELAFHFEFRSDEEKRTQKKLNQQAVEAIMELRGKAEDQDVKEILTELAMPAPTESDKNRTLLEKHIEDYTRRNTSDYFIHKDLGTFLRRELDFFIKNEIMQLDDIENDSTPRVEQYLSKVKVIRKIAHKIIDFLAQIEDFQKKLWLKKKFVVETNYCITLDRIPEELYPEIAANDAQREEWVNLFAIDKIKKDLVTVAYSNPLTIEFLKSNPFLVLDTKFFDQEFKYKLLKNIENLEESLDGLLVHSENYQALNLISKRFWSEIKCIYIDPPYNTSEETFIYKNQFKHSSWLTMMNDRIVTSTKLLTMDGIIEIAIDDEELYRLKNQVDSSIGEENYLGTVVVQSNPRGRGINSFFATSHDYYIVYAKNPDYASIVNQPLNEEQTNGFGHEDEESKYRLLPFRRSGGLSTPDERPNSEFSLFFSKSKDKIVGVGGKRLNPYPSEYIPSSVLITNTSGEIIEEQADFFDNNQDIVVIMPIDTNGSRRVWRWSDRKKILEAVINGDFEVRSFKDGYSVQLKDRIKPGRKPKTVWYDSKFDASSHGTILINNFFGDRKVFGYPKSIHSTESAIHAAIGEDVDSFCLDYFAGSATTGHAVINLNRKDNGNRKFLLIEMGQYFETVTKPRMQKVIYSEEWKDGKPVSRKGSSHAFKYIKLESYEDTLNNLDLKRTDQQTQILPGADTFREDYLLRYMLDIEAKDSLLNLQTFENPFECKLNIASNTVGESVPTKVDLVETFNYLIGLKVKTINKISGCVVVQGSTRDDEKILIIWRNVHEMDNEALDKFFRKLDISTRNFEYDTIYVNGDNNLPNLRREGEDWKVKLIEEEFHNRMFEG